jgi:hypothetical protein
MSTVTETPVSPTSRSWGACHLPPSLGPPMNAQVRARVAQELEAIPRGTLAQNIYRMIYQQARLNGLSSRAEIGPTSEDAHALALQTVREQHPDFTPIRDIRGGLDEGLEPERFRR